MIANKEHEYGEHPTYTGPGCWYCGKSKEEHVKEIEINGRKIKITQDDVNRVAGDFRQTGRDIQRAIDREISDFDEYDYHAPPKPLHWWHVVVAVVLVIAAAFVVSGGAW